MRNVFKTLKSKEVSYCNKAVMSRVLRWLTTTPSYIASSPICFDIHEHMISTQCRKVVFTPESRAAAGTCYGSVPHDSLLRPELCVNLPSVLHIEHCTMHQSPGKHSFFYPWVQFLTANSASLNYTIHINGEVHSRKASVVCPFDINNMHKL